VRTYWVGQEYKFSMITTQQKIYCLTGEGGKPQGRKQNAVLRLPKLANLETLKPNKNYCKESVTGDLQI